MDSQIRKPYPSPERMKECFEDVGHSIRWKVRGKGIRLGSVVKTIDGRGYLTVTLDGHMINVHRVLWTIRNGPIPEGMLVDHRDGNKLNNYPDNHRLARECQSNWNRGMFKNNTSGHKGVCYCKKSGKWRVQIGKEGKTIYLGTFLDIAEAARVSEAARAELHGRFTRKG